MARWSIRRMMLAIAGVAVLLGVCVWLERVYSAHQGRIQCASNLRNVILATLGYAYQNGHFPTATWPNASLSPESRLSWYAEILYMLDAPAQYNGIDKSGPWDSPANVSIGGTRIFDVTCPDVPRAPAGGLIPTSFIGIAGLGADAPDLPTGHPRAGVFGYDRQTALADITDGAAYTMVIAESERMMGSWLSGGPATVRGLDTTEQPYLGTGRQFGGLHQRSGAMAAFADGSVRFISDTVDPRIFEALSTIAGGERLPDDLFR
jgi:prepilin-type processing-associated H-X9-DG protein